MLSEEREVIEPFSCFFRLFSSGRAEDYSAVAVGFKVDAYVKFKSAVMEEFDSSRDASHFDTL